MAAAAGRRGCARIRLEGASVYLAGRSRAELDRVAADIIAAGGMAETAEVDAMDERRQRARRRRGGEVGRHRHRIQCRGHRPCPGHAVRGIDLEDFAHPIEAYTRMNFPTAKAVARHMAEQRSGRDPVARPLGQARACPVRVLWATASRWLSRHLLTTAGELGPSGIRVNRLRPHAIPESVATSHTRQLFTSMAGLSGLTMEAWLSGLAGSALLGHLRRLTKSPTQPPSWPPIVRAR